MVSFCLRPTKICHLFCKSSTIAQMQKYFLCRPQYVSTFQACIPPFTCQCCPCTSITLPMYNVHLMKMYLARWKKTLKMILRFSSLWLPILVALFLCSMHECSPPKARPTIRARALTHLRTICKICAFNGSLSYTFLQKLRYWWNSSISKWRSELKSSIHGWKKSTHNLCNSTWTLEKHWQDP